VEFDQDALRRTTGLQGDFHKYLDILIGNRLIYPDGTVSEIGQKALRAMAKHALRL
jgi:hypothetical protein